VCVREDPENKGRKYPPKKKDETKEERKQRRSLKKLARKNETPEEREVRKAAKAAKKMRKSQAHISPKSSIQWLYKVKVLGLTTTQQQGKGLRTCALTLHNFFLCQRKPGRGAQSAVPGGISSVGGTEAPTTEEQEGGSDGNESSGSD
jgi:hypothetical protein